MRLGYHPATLTARLLLQVAALLGLAYGARELAPAGPVRYAAVLLLPVLAAVAWGLCGTPGDAAGRPGRPPVPTPGALRLLLEVVVLFGGAVLLFLAGQPLWASALTVALVAYHAVSWDRIAWLLRRDTGLPAEDDAALPPDTTPPAGR